MDDSYESIKRDLIAEMRRFKRMGPPLMASSEKVTRTEGGVLHMVYLADEEGRSLRPKALARHLRTTPSALSQILKELEGKGYIVRRRSSDDSRAVTLELTKPGAKIARELDEQHDRFARALFDEVGEDEMRRFVSTFARINDYVDQERAGRRSEGGDRA